MARAEAWHRACRASDRVGTHLHRDGLLEHVHQRVHGLLLVLELALQRHALRFFLLQPRLELLQPAIHLSLHPHRPAAAAPAPNRSPPRSLPRRTEAPRRRSPQAQRSRAPPAVGAAAAGAPAGRRPPALLGGPPAAAEAQRTSSASRWRADRPPHRGALHPAHLTNPCTITAHFSR